MLTITRVTLTFIFLLLVQGIFAQEEVQRKIDSLQQRKEQINLQEKEALKKEVEAIVMRQKNGEISAEEAQKLKEEAARKRALNIENKLAILDNTIALMQRNGGVVDIEQDSSHYVTKIEIGWGHRDTDHSRIFGVRYSDRKEPKPVVYDRRTYSDMVVAFGINNAIIDGQSLGDSPYELGGSRFFELGVSWRTRVFKNSNFMRINYGLSLQFNGLQPKDNQYFVADSPETTLETFDVDLRKAKLRMDNLVVPVYFEFGPSKFTKTDTRIRYSIRNQFRIGFGGYTGFNIGTRQKLKYDRNGERVKDKLKRGYNTSDFIYGLGAYVGIDGVLLYTKYDLNPIFQDASIRQRNISFGLRFDMD
ncbi:MAG: hypothetical protein KJO16_09490 [Muriicola sp.]|nr:hypothetical protein [Muriicola sp.]MBT8282779.1 hypothetical protein [Muriicola sp.]NNK11719.1 hypothetical protein [Flavobacteriaceae bacterium]